MKLSYETISKIAQGAARIEEHDGYACFYRFTKAQEELYRVVKEDFYNKTFATAGVLLAFKTNSEKLFLAFNAQKSSSRAYFAVDVLSNGEFLGSISNIGDCENPDREDQSKFASGDFSGEFSLGIGEKTVEIYLPWSASAKISEFSLDDGATVIPAKREKQILIFGDSITQGYCAQNPSRRYAAQLAKALDAEERNKAIGGEIFRPELAELREDDTYEPDYITVAYGTNDWSASASREKTVAKFRGFYTTLAKKYPNAKIFAIAPIWRGDTAKKVRVYGDFSLVAEDIKEIVSNIENITFINAYDCVPESESFFADLYLHPNDAGFDHYAKNLTEKIKQYI